MRARTQESRRRSLARSRWSTCAAAQPCWTVATDAHGVIKGLTCRTKTIRRTRRVGGEMRAGRDGREGRMGGGGRRRWREGRRERAGRCRGCRCPRCGRRVGKLARTLWLFFSRLVGVWTRCAFALAPLQSVRRGAGLSGCRIHSLARPSFWRARGDFVLRSSFFVLRSSFLVPLRALVSGLSLFSFCVLAFSRSGAHGPSSLRRFVPSRMGDERHWLERPGFASSSLLLRVEWRAGSREAVTVSDLNFEFQYECRRLWLSASGGCCALLVWADFRSRPLKWRGPFLGDTSLSLWWRN